MLANLRCLEIAAELACHRLARASWNAPRYQDCTMPKQPNAIMSALILIKSAEEK
jgi:hypothetical protein